MLKRVLEQMQFTQEHTGGGCNAMAGYVDGHAIVVSIDAHTVFDHVGPDNPITVSIYQTSTRYSWGDDNMVTATDAHTESDALNAVIDGLDFVKERDRSHGIKLEFALGELWTLMLKRHGLPEVCAYEVLLDDLDEKPRAEVQAWLTLWDSITGEAQND